MRKKKGDLDLGFDLDAHKQFMINKYPHLEKFYENDDKYTAATHKDLGHNHVLGTPLVEVVSVKIHSKPSCKVYGTITLIDGEGASFNLYDRDESDGEIVGMGGSLTLIVPKGRAISPCGQINVLFQLKDAAHNKFVIANGNYSWDYTSKEDYGVVQTKQFGCAVMECVTYPHAVIATIDVIVVRATKRTNKNLSHARIYGEILSDCGRNYSSALFKKTKDKSMRVSCGIPIELSRHVVAVPAFSSLGIAVKLWNSNTKKQIISRKVTFEATHYSFLLGRETDFTGPNGHIRVKVHWSHAYMQPPPERMLKHKIEPQQDPDESNINHKRVRLISEQPPFMTLSDTGHSLPPPPPPPPPDIMRSTREDYGFLVMEVFSVLIGSDLVEPFDVCGTIKVGLWTRGESFIFNKGLEGAIRLLPNQLLDLTTPDRNLAGVAFTLVVDLKDANGRAISFGHLGWDERELERPILWHDKQLCSVIRGDIGYAAVNYMLISDGVRATVSVWLGGGNAIVCCPSVHGSIFAEYGKYRYVTWYEKEHYRCKLFHKLPEDGEELSSNFQVPLAKSAVVVPPNSTLIVDLDLTMKAPGEIIDEFFKDQLRFNIDMCNQTNQSIKGSRDSVVVVNVEWSEVSLPPLVEDFDPLCDDYDFSLDMEAPLARLGIS